MRLGGGGQYHLQQGSHVGMAVSELDLDENVGPARMEMAGGHARRTNKLKPRHKWGVWLGWSRQPIIHEDMDMVEGSSS